MKIKAKSPVMLFAVVVIAVAAFMVVNNKYHITGGHGKVVDDLIARNAAARGGADVWRAVTALRFSGEMDVGQDMHVPYVLEQKRPGKMCLQFEFNKQTALQCVAGNTGWKQLPFLGREAAETMTEAETREIAGMVELEGLLLDSDKRGSRVELVGKETVDGRSASKLKVTLNSGSVRWIYLDDETALEVKMEAIRYLRGKQRLMETTYSNWTTVDGLLIPHRQETRYKGEDKSQLMTVKSVTVNPDIDDQRFVMPASTRVVDASGRSS